MAGTHLECGDNCVENLANSLLFAAIFVFALMHESAQTALTLIRGALSLFNRIFWTVYRKRPYPSTTPRAFAASHGERSRG
ncbi:hypothetical protein, partial [Thiolapillus sp.]|uniref:hypothetical protein n=1 Tax=Thiolapillus sp. TaxID=2017437 RepID=UPI003AF9989F